MTQEDWDALFLDIPKEVKKWFAFPDLGKGEVRRDPAPNQYSAKGSNKQPPKKEDGHDEKDQPI